MLGHGYRYDYDYHFKKYCIGTQLKFALLPKRCYFTNKILWLRYAYKQTAMYTGPGEPAFEHRWYDKTEFLIGKLKDRV